MGNTDGHGVRDAVAADAEDVARVHVEAWRETYSGILADHHFSDEAFSRRKQFWTRYLSLEPRPVERLLTTRRYWTIQSMDPIAYGASLTALITLELNARMAAFEHGKVALESDIAVWNVPSMPGTFPEHLHAVVVDTNVLMRHKGDLTVLDWPAIAGTQSIAITVPAVVVAELDDLKHSNGKMTFGGVAHDRRWLATLALGWLERAFPGVDRRTLIRKAEIGQGGPIPQLYAVLQSDPLDHIGLAKPDSEIIDNALRLTALAKSVTLASYDSHMIFTARHLGLRAYKLPEDPEQSAEDVGS